MAIDFVALHEPLVEWVHEQTAADATEYVTITAFGELHGLDEAYGAVLAIVLHPARPLLRHRDVRRHRHPDPLHRSRREPPATAVQVRFAEATHRGTVDPATMARVDQALRAVLDL
ncbi:hypothetical protein OG581_01500 [Streptomyces sp. NBC_01386]|uniref:hypothetical protein n=1 Tax=Streptomyces sp. NBC_01386 TaxID=2903848 RepID=UPI003250DA2B